MTCASACTYTHKAIRQKPLSKITACATNRKVTSKKKPNKIQHVKTMKCQQYVRKHPKGKTGWLLKQKRKQNACPYHEPLKGIADSFQVGHIKNHFKQWIKITNNSEILESVRGAKMPSNLTHVLNKFTKENLATTRYFQQLQSFVF